MPKPPNPKKTMKNLKKKFFPVHTDINWVVYAVSFGQVFDICIGSSLTDGLPKDDHKKMVWVDELAYHKKWVNENVQLSLSPSTKLWASNKIDKLNWNFK